MGVIPGLVGLRAECIVLGVLVTLAVVGRLYIRKTLSGKLHADDYLAVAAGLSFWAFNGIMLWMAFTNGVLANIETASVDEYTDFGIMNFVINPLSFLSLSLSRFSVIVLFYRLFYMYKRFVLALKAIGVACVIWFIVTSCLWIFRCDPMYYAWGYLPPRMEKLPCLNPAILWTWTESINAGLDVFLVLMPIAVIRKLTLATREKLGLSIVFVSGGLVCVCSILRILYEWGATHWNWNWSYMTDTYLLIAQHAYGVICACLPIYKSIFSAAIGRMLSAVHDLTGWLSGARSSQRDSSRHESLHPTFKAQQPDPASSSDESTSDNAAATAGLHPNSRAPQDEGFSRYEITTEREGEEAV